VLQGEFLAMGKTLVAIRALGARRSRPRRHAPMVATRRRAGRRPRREPLGHLAACEGPSRAADRDVPRFL
jgi:hypothetical protein